MSTTDWWLLLLVSSVYCLGLGAMLAALHMILSHRPAGWEWVPDGLFVERSTMYRRATVNAMLWPVSIPAMYSVGKSMGLSAGRSTKALVVACFCFAVIAGLVLLSTAVGVIW